MVSSLKYVGVMKVITKYYKITLRIGYKSDPLDFGWLDNRYEWIFVKRRI